MFRRSKARSEPDSEAQIAYQNALKNLETIQARTPEAKQLTKEIQAFQKTPKFMNHVQTIARRLA